MLRELREGWSVFTGHTWLWVVVAGFGVMNAIHAGAWFTLGPALARETFGVRGWGYVLSAESVGLLLMTLVMLRVRLRPTAARRDARHGAVRRAAADARARPARAPAGARAFLAGAGIEVFSIGWSVAMQEHIDERVLSRAYSYDALGSFVAMPARADPLRPARRRVRLPARCSWSAAVVYLGVVLLVLSSRSVRDLRRVEPKEPVSV